MVIVIFFGLNKDISHREKGLNSFNEVSMTQRTRGYNENFHVEAEKCTKTTITLNNHQFQLDACRKRINI